MSIDIKTHDDLDLFMDCFPNEEQSQDIEPSSPWVPDSADKANWLLEKLAAVNESDAADEEIAKREAARIDLWLSRRKAQRDAKRKWLMTSLEWFAREQHKATGAQTISLPFGKLSLRKPVASIKLIEGTDEKELVAWLKTNMPELVKAVESPRLGDLKKLCVLPSWGEPPKEATIKDTGEVVPGVVLEIAGDMIFAVAAEGGVK